MKPRSCPTCHSTRICASVQIPTIWQCLNRSCEVAFFDAQGVMATADALSRLRQQPRTLTLAEVEAGAARAAERVAAQQVMAITDAGSLRRMIRRCARPAGREPAPAAVDARPSGYRQPSPVSFGDPVDSHDLRGGAGKSF